MDNFNKDKTGNDRKVSQILIVDDEGDVCYLLSKLLKERGMEFEQVNTIGQAETFLMEKTPDILFLDHNLPDGQGINFINNVRDKYPDVKIVLITAHDNLITRNRALRNGADIFLSKPFTSKQVFDAIEKLSTHSKSTI